MAGETISTNMSLPIPSVGTTAGPTWATDVNTCLNIIDAHDHSSGSGVLITPSGMNINGDLPFASNSVTGLKKAAFNSQSGALTGTNFLSFISGNLYVNDSSGNQIPITSGGGVAGSPGSIGSLASPAAATYSAGSKLFTWTADSGKAAAMDNGAITIRETNVASAKGITISSPTSLAADYNLTLFTALPGSTSYVNCDASGNLGTVSANTIAAGMTSTGADAIAASMSSTGTGSIVATATAANANTLVDKVTRSTGTSVGHLGVAISTSCGIFTSSSSSLVDVTNLTVTIITSGRPVRLQLISSGTASSPASIQPATTSVTLTLLRDGVELSAAHLWQPSGSLFSVSSYSHIDTPAAGTYVYKIQGKNGGGVNSWGVSKAILVAYEL